MEHPSETPWLNRLRKAAQVDSYFLTEKCPFSQKRRFKTQTIKRTLLGLLVVGLVFVLFAGNGAEQQAKTFAEPSTVNQGAMNQPSRGYSATVGSVGLGGSSGSTWGFGDSSRGRASAHSGTSAISNRQYGASQLVRPGSEGIGAGVGLPMGSTIPVRLVNTLLSSDSNQPVMAEVLEDAVWRNTVLIPAGSRAIGNASFDDAAKRLQIRFHTFVYPDGDQHPVSALALLNNGSSGLPGDFHSGTTQKELGRFMGNFIGGLADGMKERQAGGHAGIAFEPGSIRNGILNGLAVSSLDQAKSYSEGMQNVRPYLEVAGGTAFLLYFEKEYTP